VCVYVCVCRKEGGDMEVGEECGKIVVCFNSVLLQCTSLFSISLSDVCYCLQ